MDATYRTFSPAPSPCVKKLEEGWACLSHYFKGSLGPYLWYTLGGDRCVGCEIKLKFQFWRHMVTYQRLGFHREPTVLPRTKFQQNLTIPANQTNFPGPVFRDSQWANSSQKWVNWTKPIWTGHIGLHRSTIVGVDWKCRTWNCRTWKCRKRKSKAWNDFALQLLGASSQRFNLVSNVLLGLFVGA